MNNVNWNRVETIIDQALDLSIEKRTEFIEEECAGNQQLKGEVTLLLESIFEADGWLENPSDYKRDFYDEISYDVRLISTDQSLIGTEIGSYVIKEKIGEGGMGSVYLAERSGDFEHRVAIKIIRSAKATEDNVRRFKQEQRILAGLNHPGIAKLFDAGATEDSVPYIIMEYVNGIPITVYCQQNNYTTDQKLELFGDILQAVRYAHENLVIHRDLKPGNILVDQSGNIKILDFGISKLLKTDEDSSLTQTGTRLLTPRYAAPEQVRQDNITTSTDLYALGIVFYQLLSHEHPFDFETLSRYQMEQAILSQETDKPSTKVSDSKLKKLLRGDLDAIALKAIRKESGQRYRVANEFLDDLKNYQNGVPVSAQKDSYKYRSQKFFKRHKKGLTVAAGLLLLVIGLTGFYAWQIAQERNEAQMEAQKAEQVSEFLMDLFRYNHPNRSKGEPITAQILLSQGINRANTLDNQPEVQAKMFSLIGDAFLSQGIFNRADSVYQLGINAIERLGNPAHPRKLALSNSLGNVFMERGDYEEANSKFRHVLQMTNEYDMPNQRAITLNDLGNLRQTQSNFAVAESLHREALKLRTELYGDNNEEVAASLNNIGLALHRLGKLSEAEKYYFRALQLGKQIHGEMHTETNQTRRNLAQLFMTMEKFNLADSLLRKTITIDIKLLGRDHPRVAEDLNELAVLNARQSNYYTADTLFQQILEIQKKTLSPNHPRIALTLNNLSWVVLRQDKIETAEKYNRKAITIAQNNFGNVHRNTALYKYNLAKVLFRQKEYDEAEPLFREALSTLHKVLPEGHSRISDPLVGLGQLLDTTDRSEEAESLLREALSIRMKSYGGEHKQTTIAQTALKKCLINLGKSEEAMRIN